jgi:hypothetical protein
VAYFAVRGRCGTITQPQGALRLECVVNSEVRALKQASRQELYVMRAWFLANQKLVGTMFAFNALNAIEQALEAK